MRGVGAQFPRAHRLPLAEEMSPEEKGEIIEAFLRARGGRIEPIWANHTEAERTANLLQHSHRAARRRLQMGRSIFQDTSGS